VRNLSLFGVSHKKQSRNRAYSTGREYRLRLAIQIMAKARMMLRAGIGATVGHPINGFTTNMKKTVTTAAMSKRIASSCPNV
jgi:hypothetical protein